MCKKFTDFMHDDSGSTAIEYGLIAAILSLAIITSLKSMRTELQSTFSKVKTELLSANN